MLWIYWLANAEVWHFIFHFLSFSLLVLLISISLGHLNFFEISILTYLYLYIYIYIYIYILITDHCITFLVATLEVLLYVHTAAVTFYQFERNVEYTENNISQC